MQSFTVQAYDKTIDALKEAEKELGKALPTSKDPVRIESALTQIKHRIKLIATFLENDSLTLVMCIQLQSDCVSKCNGKMRK